MSRTEQQESSAYTSTDISVAGASPALNDGVIAAVDLGSNSFHMIVATLRHGQLTVIDRLRETVRLAEGLRAKKGIAKPSRKRAISCLERFGERLRSMHAKSVRAAGTNTLRLAIRDTHFLRQAEQALGHPIEVISGIEEARLIYLGVVNGMPPNDGKRLVVDIGGGSTELILGQGFKSEALESVGLGCVGSTERFFGDGKITAKRFDQARLAARLKLRPIKGFFRKADWSEAIGTSGTIRAAQSVASELGVLDHAGLTASATEKLIRQIIALGRVEKLDLPGLSARRAQVIAGGLAILAEVMSALRIEQLSVSDWSLREGLLYDLLGRIRHEDARVASVRALEERYHTDTEQAQRVSSTAEALRAQVEKSWGLDGERPINLLNWAARLHELGLDISHAEFERHGAYVLHHSDLAGFPDNEKQMLAYMVLNQRKRFDEAMLAERPPAIRQNLLRRLTIILRLAVLLHRSRSTAEAPAPAIKAKKRSVTLSFDPQWLQRNALTRADLEREARYLRALGYRLEYS